MENFRMTASMVNGDGIIFNDATGKEILLKLFGDDLRPPLSHLYIEAKTKDGKEIIIEVPNDNSQKAFVEIK